MIGLVAFQISRKHVINNRLRKTLSNIQSLKWKNRLVLTQGMVACLYSFFALPCFQPLVRIGANLLYFQRTSGVKAAS